MLNPTTQLLFFVTAETASEIDSQVSFSFRLTLETD